MQNERIGFSTGALERGEYLQALNWMRAHQVRTAELSALRLDELEPLVNDLGMLPVESFQYVSFHAPSSFPREDEARVITLLAPVAQRGWNIVVHPDVIYTPALWQQFGRQLLVENMDRRKNTGRTVDELSAIFRALPEARLCVDVAHARQLDTTLTLLRQITTAFAGRIGEVHLSELDSRCRHRPLSDRAVADYRRFSASFRNVPVIIESTLGCADGSEREQEVRLAHDVLRENGTGA